MIREIEAANVAAAARASASSAPSPTVAKPTTTTTALVSSSSSKMTIAEASRAAAFTDALDATSHGERNTDQADQAPSRHVARARGRARPVSAKVGASRTNSYMDALDAVSDSQRPWARTAPGAAWL